MKPSPVPSILLFIATAMLAFSLFGRGWWNHESETISMSGGPLWSTVCVDMGDGMDCKTETVFSNLGKNVNGFTLLFLLFVLTGIAGLILAGISGLLLLKRPKAGTTLVAIILLGVSLLIVLGTVLYSASKGGTGSLPGYGFFVFLLGGVLAMVGGFMGMASSRGGAPNRPMYGYGPPPGYGPGYPPGPGQPGYGMGAPQGYPPQGSPQPYAPPQPTAPAAAPAGQPHAACGTPMTFVAQYQRWFCPRCNQYS